ncbi:MAG: hypothetical protein RLY50_336, partial [Actinomycetota bacterium]
FIAGGLGIVTGIPQAQRVRALGHGRGVSLMSWFVIASANSAWFGYGVRIDAPAVSVSNFLTLLVTVTVIVSLAGATVSTVSKIAAIVAGSSIAAWGLPTALVSVAMIGFTLSRAPQVLESWRSKKNNAPGTAVSIPSLVVSLSSLLLWGAYSVAVDKPFLVLTTGIALLLAVAIAWLEMTNRPVSDRQMA